MKKTGLNRKSTDKFYTNKNIAENIITDIKAYIQFKSSDLIIEPSAGNGVFIPFINTLSSNLLCYDIEPHNDLIIRKDFLNVDFTDFSKYTDIHIIGNPPFGRQSSLVIKFIKKITKNNVKSISFILPKSFKKNSLKKHFPLNYHLIFEKELENNSFNIDDIIHDVPCIFQIWILKDTKRKAPIKLKPYHYKFVKKTEDHDISFRRVGINAGDIDMETTNKSIQSHYFIKFDDDIFNKELFKLLKKVKFITSSDTVGPKSIGKQELMKEYNSVLH